MWANERLFDVVEQLSEDDYTTNLGSSYGGIRGTMAHMYGAEYVWSSRLEGHSPEHVPGETEHPEWAELKRLWRRLSLELHKTCKDAPEGMVVTYTTTTGSMFTQSTYEIISHLVNHGSYHRGQVVTMIRQLEERRQAPPEKRLKIPQLDMIAFYRA